MTNSYCDYDHDYLLKTVDSSYLFFVDMYLCFRSRVVDPDPVGFFGQYWQQCFRFLGKYQVSVRLLPMPCGERSRNQAIVIAFSRTYSYFLSTATIGRLTVELVIRSDLTNASWTREAWIYEYIATR
jgi:hypothetical protein